MLGKQKIICGRLSISQIRLFFFSYYADIKKLAKGACTRLLLYCFFFSPSEISFFPLKILVFFSRSFDDFNCGSNFAFGESILVFRWNPSHNLLFFPSKIRPRLNNIFFQNYAENIKVNAFYNKLADQK